MSRSRVLLNAIKIVVPVLLFLVFCFALLNSSDKKTFFTNYVGFYINFFILIVWFVINKVFSRMGKKEKKTIKELLELNDVILDEDKENIHVHGGKSSFISYQVFDDRKECKKMLTFWVMVIYMPFVLIILGMLPLPCPNFVESNHLLKDIFCNTTGEQLFELFIMTMASVFNVIYLLLSFYEKGKTGFFVVSATSWSHEKEYRIVYPLVEGKGMNVSISNLGMRTCRIVAGINCSEENMDKLNDISNELGLGNIYVSEIHPEKYTLNTIQRRNP